MSETYQQHFIMFSVEKGKLKKKREAKKEKKP
jgi:hypothetical protein